MTWLLVAGIFILVAVNGFFVAAEFALVRSRRSRIEDLASGRKGAERALAELDELSEYLSACQLGITLASIGIGFLGEPAVADLVEPLFPSSFSHGAALAISLVISYALTTALHITIGEQVPKIMAITRAETTAVRIARPLHVFTRVFGPPVRALNAVSNSILRLMGVDPEAEFTEGGGSPEEIRRLIAESAAGGLLPRGQADMIGGVFGLEQQQARHVMTPAPNVTRVPSDVSAGQAAQTCVESGHTRLVVMGPDGGVQGVLHASRVLALLLAEGAGAPIATVVVEALVVPETRPLPDLLRELRAARVSLAVVVDEYGRMAGVVTIEDVLEEIVGEISDETDPTELPVRVVGDGEWQAHGEVSLADLVDDGIELPSEGSVTSLGGLVLHLAGRLPEPGDRFESNGFELDVVELEGTRVAEVRIRRLPDRGE